MRAKTSMIVTALLLLNGMVFFGLAHAQSGRSTNASEASELAPGQATPQGQATATHGPPDFLDLVSDDGTFSLRLSPGDTPRIVLELDNPGRLQAYYAANTARIARLLAQPQRRGQVMEVTVTFNRPVEWTAFTQLRETVGLEPIQYSFAEMSPSGEKWAQDQIAVLAGEVRTDDALIADVATEAEAVGVEVLGVILVQARITISPETLGVLAADPRVYAVDTAEAEATELMARHGLDLADFSYSSIVRVWVPSPFWSLDWSAE
jgi:hypothetical protein